MDSSFPPTSDTKIIIHIRMDDKMNQPSRILPVLQKIRQVSLEQVSQTIRHLLHPSVVNLVGPPHGGSSHVIGPFQSLPPIFEKFHRPQH